MIYHITKKQNWILAEQSGFYYHISLTNEGFIHASKLNQVAGVLHRYYQNETGLLLLHIDESKLTSLVSYELSPSINEIFPHIYGPINANAVVKTEGI